MLWMRMRQACAEHTEDIKGCNGGLLALSAPVLPAAVAQQHYKLITMSVSLVLRPLSSQTSLSAALSHDFVPALTANTAELLASAGAQPVTWVAVDLSFYEYLYAISFSYPVTRAGNNRIKVANSTTRPLDDSGYSSCQNTQLAGYLSYLGITTQYVRMLAQYPTCFSWRQVCCQCCVLHMEACKACLQFCNACLATTWRPQTLLRLIVGAECATALQSGRVLAISTVPVHSCADMDFDLCQVSQAANSCSRAIIRSRQPCSGCWFAALHVCLHVCTCACAERFLAHSMLYVCLSRQHDSSIMSTWCLQVICMCIYKLCLMLLTLFMYMLYVEDVWRFGC
jgi:hypothetical protein